MTVQEPSPQTTLVVLLGASEWPQFPEFQSSEAFANAARELKAYFLDSQQFGLPVENLLDLFDSNHGPNELDVEVGRFFEQRMTAMKTAGNVARDVLLYFVGHGGFVGRDYDFYLAIRCTRMENPRISGLQMISLADTLTEKARHLRRIIILDCCFASAAFSAFQTGPAQVAIEKTIDAFEVNKKRGGFPGKGTALLCSSGHKTPSLLLPDSSSTMFTKALVDALTKGLTSQGDNLSLRDVKDFATNLLSETRNAPRPVIHSPDQSEGDVADIPFFPNLAVKASAVMPTPDGRQKIEEQQRVVRSQEETAVAGSSFIDTLQQLGLDKAALQRLRSNTPMALDARLIAEADNQEFDLSGKDNVLIGREDAVANIFPDVDLTPHGGKKGGVDRAHARIFVENGQYMLEDENSTNFTFLNRQRLASMTPTPLHHNDEIRLGRVLLRFLKG